MNQTNKVFYTLVAIFLSCSIEMAGQVQKVISGTVTELFGKTAEPLVGVNVNLVNNQNRSLGGGITNLNLSLIHISFCFTRRILQFCRKTSQSNTRCRFRTCKWREADESI